MGDLNQTIPAGRTPLIRAIVAQLLAAVLLVAMAYLNRQLFLLAIPFWGWLAGQGILAALIGEWLGLPRWWCWVHLLLPFAIYVALALQLPPWVYLIAFVLLWLVFWNSTRERVPLYLSNPVTWQALQQLLPEQSGIRFVDLGSGLSGTLNALARGRPDGEFVGVESAPIPAMIAWLRFKLRPLDNVTLVVGDIWQQDLSQYDVVYCFLSSEPMPRLYVKAKKEMRPGSLLISNSFTVPGVPASEILQLEDGRRTRLHIWRI